MFLKDYQIKVLGELKRFSHAARETRNAMKKGQNYVLSAAHISKKYASFLSVNHHSLSVYVNSSTFIPSSFIFFLNVFLLMPKSSAVLT